MRVKLSKKYFQSGHRRICKPGSKSKKIIEPAILQLIPIILFTSFYFCRLVPRLTTNLRRLALTYKGFEMVQNSSQVFLNLQTLANTCDTFRQKIQKYAIGFIMPDMVPCK